MRCSRCETVFRVPPPSAAASDSARPLVLVAEPDADTAKAIAQLLARWGLDPQVVHDGVEALLFLHRRSPALAVLGGHLPGVPARALAEVARRSSELRAVKLIRVATLKEPAGAPEFDADETLEAGDLPEGIAPLLERLRLGQRPAEAPAPLPARAPAPRVVFPAAAPAPVRTPTPPATHLAPTRSATPVAKPALAASTPAASAAAARKVRRSRPVSSDPRIAAAERLARIIVSDIILYNEGKFAAGVKAGNVAAAIRDELAEGIQLFAQRIPDEIRKQREFLSEELQFRIEQLRDKVG